MQPGPEKVGPTLAMAAAILQTKEDFFLAVQHGDLDVAKEAVEVAQPRLTMNGWTLLFAAAARNASLGGAEVLCRRLIARHVNVRGSDKKGRTPLFYAAESGHASLCTYLVTRVGMSVDDEDDSGLTPLACALKAGEIDASVTLLRQGASLGYVNSKGIAVYQFASEYVLGLLQGRKGQWVKPNTNRKRSLQDSQACDLETLEEWAAKRPKCFAAGEPIVRHLADRVIVENETHSAFVPLKDPELRKVRLLEKGLVLDQARLFQSELFVHAMPPEHWADTLGTHSTESVATNRIRRVVQSTSQDSETIVAAVCRASGHIVGFSRASKRPFAELYIETLKVQAGHELQGIARLMIQAAEIQAAKKGFATAKVGSRCLRQNVNAQRFFKRLGFAEDELGGSLVAALTPAELSAAMDYPGRDFQALLAFALPRQAEAGGKEENDREDEEEEEEEEARFGSQSGKLWLSGEEAEAEAEEAPLQEADLPGPIGDFPNMKSLVAASRLLVQTKIAGGASGETTDAFALFALSLLGGSALRELNESCAKNETKVVFRAVRLTGETLAAYSPKPLVLPSAFRLSCCATETPQLRGALKEIAATSVALPSPGRNSDHQVIVTKVIYRTIHDAGPGAVIAIDTEFPGVYQEDAWKKSGEVQYRAMRDSVSLLKPIQLGLAVGSPSGGVKGAWTFNLHFDLSTDVYRESAVRFLMEAGVNFDQHAKEGINPLSLGHSLRTSLGQATWLTFAGLYDLGYLLLLSKGGSLPEERGEFQDMLSASSAGNEDLRDWLPFGSLSRLPAQSARLLGGKGKHRTEAVGLVLAAAS
ncbi:CNOT8, partial [Symbiodinium microadriaticum]